MDVLDELLDAFEQKYSPASSIGQAKELLSSQEILNLFESAANVDKDQLYEQLRDRGFETTIVNGSFLWMLREK